MALAMMRLLVDPASGISQQAADRAYISGLDQIPWPCRSRLRDGELTIERAVTESGKFQIPFPVNGRGEVMLTTGTLMQRDRPYRLEIELARGKLNQVRHQIADWQAMGLVVPPAVSAALRAALDEFSRAVTGGAGQADASAIARHAIVLAVEVGELLADAYCEQALALRHRQQPKFPTWLGVRLGHRVLPAAALAHLQATFNCMSVPILWREVEGQEEDYQWDVYDRQIEWCQSQNIPVCGGPMLCMDRRGMPDWLALWENNFEELLNLAGNFVATVVRRYKGKVALWQCAARVNVAQVFSLHEEQKLQMAVRALEMTRREDPSTPAIVRIDQPWGEYMRRTDFDLSPLHFADALVRAGLQLGGIGLEINVGYYPAGSAPRDRLEFSRMLDLWSLLGLPLHLTLTVPSGEQPDPKAHGESAPLPGASSWTPELQLAWVRAYIPLMLSKSYVQSVTWNQLSDADAHEFPHGGLFDAAGAAKPSFAALAQFRKKHLA